MGSVRLMGGNPTRCIYFVAGGGGLEPPAFGYRCTMRTPVMDHFAAAKDARVMNVESGDIGLGAAALVIMIASD